MSSKDTSTSGQARIRVTRVSCPLSWDSTWRVELEEFRGGNCRSLSKCARRLELCNSGHENMGTFRHALQVKLKEPNDDLDMGNEGD